MEAKTTYNTPSFTWKVFSPLSITVSLTLLSILTVNIQATAKSTSDAVVFMDIHGRIVNEQKQPISGATVTLKGTHKMTSTDDNGEFNMKKIQENAILIITSVNSETVELEVKGQKELVVVLRSKTQQLEEVAVEMNTGYQKIPKERATGSFDFIDNKTLNAQTGTNVLQRINGVSSGVLFETNKRNLSRAQSALNISIRGLSTINGPLDPLIVFDGFIYDGDINNINPNDIDNITILKDAAATAIWGARAGNGVIVITSKKGKFGQKLKVGFNANIIINQKPDLSYLRQMSSGDFIDVEQFLFNQGYFNAYASTPYLPLTPAVQIFFDKRAGLISATDSAQRIDELKAVDARDQYRKYVLRNTITQQYAINLSGGTENNAYSFSASYDKNLGELQDRSHKINLKLDNLFRPARGLQVSLGVYYTNSKAISGMPSYGNISIGGRQIPYMRLADNSGNPVSVGTTYRNSYTDTAGGGKLLDWKYYPLEDYKHDMTTQTINEIFANIGIRYRIIRYLDIDLKYQYEKQQSATDQWSDPESFRARNMVNLFTQIDPGTGTVEYVLPVGGIRNLNSSDAESQTGRGQLEFNNTWGDHSLSAILGAEIHQRSGQNSGNIFYGYNTDPISYANVDYLNYYRTYATGYYQSIPSYLSFSNTVYRFVSLYMNASYTFKNRYILSASARRDGSNIFGANTNDKWKPLWSGGIAWKVSDEPFYKSALIPHLKFRATYGFNGNLDVTKTALAVGNYFTGANLTNYPYVRIQNVNNPDLRWEKTAILNIGLDYSFKRNIISGSLEYYLKNGSDLYGLTPYDYTTTGRVGEIIKNVANMKGYGIDLILNSRNIDRKFKWISTVMLNYNTSKTTKYYSSTANDLNMLIGDGSTITPVIGKPLYAIAAYKWGGLDATGNPQGYIDNKKSTDYTNIIGTGEIVYVGPSTPTVFGSLINTFIWEHFSLSVNIAYKVGYYFRKPSIVYGSLINYGQGDKEYTKRWQKSGDESITNVPAFQYPDNEGADGFYSTAEINVLKADHIRLQYINLSYNLSSRKLSKLPFGNIQCYINTANLGILWKANKEGLDPDYLSILPPERAITFGIRTGF